MIVLPLTYAVNRSFEQGLRLTPIRQKYSTHMQSWADVARVADILTAGLLVY